PEGAAVVVGGRLRPRLGVGAELLERSLRIRIRTEQERPPLERDATLELLFDATQAHGRVVAPGTEIVGPDEQGHLVGHADSFRHAASRVKPRSTARGRATPRRAPG